ncbi:MAG: hypothetical protein H3C59_04180 [Burkholderiaceae bacterium]|nr:hypothetical protein [Burkholderiaceae bacterium]
MAFSAALAFGAGFAPAASATDVGVSVQVGQPGFYGRIDIGNAPRPVLVYPEPIIVQPAPVAMVRQPVYLHVPPGHAKNWAKHCHRYSACGQPVYFVQDRWYQDVYVPRYRSVHRSERHYEHEREHAIERSARGRDGRGNGHPGNDRGHGNGKGKGRG